MAKDLSYQFDTYYIYSLSHPITNEIKYIGQSRNIKVRLSGHINIGSVPFDRDSIKDKWIKELKDQGLRPIIKIVEECTFENAKRRETFHIWQLTFNGCKLLNSNEQMINLKRTTGFVIDIPNKSLYILQELALVNKTTREDIVSKLVVGYTESLDLNKIGSEFENFSELMNQK